jgi:diguanylate cyclase (GGDEF)-like protein
MQFGLRIALPAFLVLIGTIATVLVSLREMADEVNRIQERLTTRSAEAAVQSFVRRLGESHDDYADWDDAVRNLYGTVDKAFVSENFVSSTATANFFDTTYLIDEAGRDAFAYRNGEPVTTPSRDAFGPVLAEMIKALPADGHTYGFKVGMLKTIWGLAAMAVGPVVPNTPNQAPPPRSRYLVIAKAFDNAAVQRLAEDYVIDGLRLAAPDEAAAVTIRDPDGTEIGRLTWPARQLGNVAHARISPLVFVMLFLIVVTVLILMAIAARGFRRIRASEADARHIALHDALTGLPNRIAFVQALDQAIAARRRDGTPVAVAYLDLDGFKEVNDAYGHETGDRLLKLVAAGFTMLCRGHVLARIGGDEFALIAAGSDAAEIAAEIGGAMIGHLNRPFDIDGRAIAVGTSVGIAEAGSEDPSAEELLRRADVAMYQAKQEGPNRQFVYDALIDTVRYQRLDVAEDLRKALREDGLEIAYQPVFEADSQRIVCVEALLRWTRPDVGPVSPASFVAIAEETGLIDDLGAWTLRRACRDALAWPGVRLSVNVSPAQFRDLNFQNRLSEILAETGFPANRLEIEVTETYLVTHPEQARKAIEAVRSLGISVALDDFGTGFSSIGYLRTFKFDKLKLDRSLIVGIARDQRVQRLVQATVALAAALDLKVTAEGVELEEEARMLRLAGVDEFQGFFFARPRPAARIPGLLEGERQRMPASVSA